MSAIVHYTQAGMGRPARGQALVAKDGFIMVQGAALADFTMISGFDLDITAAITNGAMVEVDPGERPCIRVLP